MEKLINTYTPALRKRAILSNSLFPSPLKTDLPQGAKKREIR